MKQCQLPDCRGFYQLILMDIAMPIKDGHLASNEIL